MVSTGSGAAQNLVGQGTNGYTYASFHADELVRHLVAASNAPTANIAEVAAASAFIEAYETQRFASTATSLVETLRTHPVQHLLPSRRTLLAPLS